MTRDSLRWGFRVEAFLQLQKWKVLETGSHVPLTSISVCPCDEEELRPPCTFVSDDGLVRLRVGCCESCGHITYMDRPTRAWMDSYYLAIWDTERLDPASSQTDQEALHGID